MFICYALQQMEAIKNIYIHIHNGYMWIFSYHGGLFDFSYKIITHLLNLRPAIYHVYVIYDVTLALTHTLKPSLLTPTEWRRHYATQWQ